MSDYAIIVLIFRPVVQRAKGIFPLPTHEERLTILEYDLKQYKTETIKAYGEMAIEMIMVKGLVEDAVKRLASLRTQVEQRFERVDTRLDTIDTRLDTMDTRFDRLENMLSQVLARLPEKPLS